jgi:hypothetical protein
MVFIIVIIFGQIVDLWVMTPFSIIDRYQHTRETCCILLQGQSEYDESVNSYTEVAKNMVRLRVEETESSLGPKEQ